MIWQCLIVIVSLIFPFLSICSEVSEFNEDLSLMITETRRKNNRIFWEVGTTSTRKYEQMQVSLLDHQENGNEVTPNLRSSKGHTPSIFRHHLRNVRFYVILSITCILSLFFFWLITNKTQNLSFAQCQFVSIIS